MISDLKSVVSCPPYFSLPDSLVAGQWPTALAPMQDVTGLPFMEVVSRRGAPDFFFTEFLRVHTHSKIDEDILASITKNPTSQPVFAQLIGENIDDLRRTVREFKQHPAAGIDLNLGCPAPRVFKKNVGGGLLRTPQRISEILKMLREEVDTLLTVKMRIGFEDDRFFSELLEIMNESNVDLLSLHARTVLGGYRSKPSYLHVEKAVKTLNCPVMLNGNVSTPSVAIQLRNSTGAHGVMIGRSAIRNPWIFRQIRESQAGKSIFRPKLGDVYEYVHDLYLSLIKPGVEERKSVARMKKFLNFVGLSVDPDGKFLYEMRRASTKSDLFRVCSSYLLDNGKESQFYNIQPFDGLVARPSSESVDTGCQN
jgi:tRNA-dihydrouridine synthase B